MKRKFDPAELEMMDRPQPVSPELKKDLQNLRQLNRWLGSYALIRHFLRRWIKTGDRLRILDLATGSGDIPRMIVDYARSIGASVRVDAIEQNAATLEIAISLSRDYREISYAQGNIVDWQPANLYDIVLCSLVLHHFSEEDAVRVLKCCRRLSAKFVVVADLRRGLLASVGIHLLTRYIFRDPMTRIDARLSAERAFSFREFRSLAKRAGWQNFGHRRFRFARQALWLKV